MACVRRLNMQEHLLNGIDAEWQEVPIAIAGAWSRMKTLRYSDEEGRRIASNLAALVTSGLLEATSATGGKPYTHVRRAVGVRESRLNANLLVRIARIKNWLDDVHPKSIAEWIEGFEQDVYTEAEVFIWERMGLSYAVFAIEHVLSPEQKAEVLEATLDLSLGKSEQEVLERDWKHLTTEQMRIPANVNGHSGEGEHRHFLTHHESRFIPQVFTFSQFRAGVYASIRHLMPSDGRCA